MAKRCPVCHKASYGNAITAFAAALRVSRVLGPTRAYRPPRCGVWHLTTKQRVTRSQSTSDGS